MNKEFIKLFIKLRHINIYNYWLCQEYSERQVEFHWTSIKRISADEFIKTLSRQYHKEFMKMISLEDISTRI